MANQRRTPEKRAPRPGGRASRVRALVHARALNASAEAAAYLDATRHDGVPSLAYWRGAWHRWRASAYHVAPESEIRAELVRWLTPRCRLTSSFTTNVLDCLQALAMLPGWVEQPSWRDDDDRPTAARWPAGEMLAAPNALVHLPSFSATQNEPDVNARTTKRSHRKSNTRPRKPAVPRDAAQDYALSPTPRFFNAAALEFDFDASAPPPVEWLRFLEKLWPGDEARANLLQDWFGYLLTRDTSQQKILLVVGPQR